jgi:hypothetical protein
VIQARARASASACVFPTRTIERSGWSLPDRITHAIQCGPRAALRTSYDPEFAAIRLKTYQIWLEFATNRRFARKSRCVG